MAKVAVSQPPLTAEWTPSPQEAKKSIRSDVALGWSLVAPALVILLLMTIAPAFYLLQASFYNFTLLNPDLKQFVGLDNYVQVFTDPTIRNGFFVTLLFVAVSVTIELLLGLGLACALAPRSFANNLASTVLLLPFAVTPVVSALIWRELLNPNYGWVDYYLQRVGLIHRPIEWLSSAPTAWVAMVSLDVWQWTPFVALILMAGLQGLPQEPKEAAAVDGATAWQTFWHVTLPQLRPFIAIAVLLRVVEAFKTFGTVQILTGGGPGPLDRTDQPDALPGGAAKLPDRRGGRRGHRVPDPAVVHRFAAVASAGPQHRTVKLESLKSKTGCR